MHGTVVQELGGAWLTKSLWRLNRSCCCQQFRICVSGNFPLDGTATVKGPEWHWDSMAQSDGMATSTHIQDRCIAGQ